MKKIAILSICMIIHISYAVDLSLLDQEEESDAHDRLIRMVRVARESEDILDQYEKQKVLKRFIDDAPPGVLDWIPSFYVGYRQLDRTDAILSSGNNRAIQDYINEYPNSDYPAIRTSAIQLSREFYKKILEKDMSLAVRFYNNILEDRELMATFLFSTRFKDVLLPPSMVDRRAFCTKDGFLQHPKLKNIFLDTILRMQNEQLITLLHIQNPRVFTNAFMQGDLSLHLAVQINWYDMVKAMLKQNPLLIESLNSQNKKPGYYTTWDNKRMINLLQCARAAIEKYIKNQFYIE